MTPDQRRQQFAYGEAIASCRHPLRGVWLWRDQQWHWAPDGCERCLTVPLWERGA